LPRLRRGWPQPPPAQGYALSFLPLLKQGEEFEWPQSCPLGECPCRQMQQTRSFTRYIHSMLSTIVLLSLVIVPGQKTPESAGQAEASLSLGQVAVEVSNLLQRAPKAPALLPSTVARKIESIVNRIDWNKEQIHKGARMLPEPSIDPQTGRPNIIWEAYALLYAAQDVKLKRPQLVDTMLCRLWPVDSAAKLEAMKKAVDANRVKSGKDRGAIQRPVQWQNVTVTANEELKSKSWPWIKDNLSGRLTLAPIYIEEMSSSTPPPSSKVYFDWWNQRDADSDSP